MAERIFPAVVVRRDVACQSSRNGVKPTAIVIHSTESSNRPGSGDLAAIANFFDNPSTQASSHVCVDADGHSARMVDDQRKAWHAAAFNSLTLGIEQIGRAAQSLWAGPEVRETARWVAYWSRHHGIPIRIGAVSDGKITKSGVVTHKMLGQAGGGHWDPGPGYPLRRMLVLARHYKKRQDAAR